MALRNITGKLLKAWYEMLNTYIPGVGVYRSDVSPTETGNYIIIRPESETTQSNNQEHVTTVVIITEVVARFPVAIDDEIVCNIDNQIASLLFPGGPAVHGLAMQDNIQITNVTRQNSTYLTEDDGTRRVSRLVTRNVHRVLQLSEAS